MTVTPLRLTTSVFDPEPTVCYTRMFSTTSASLIGGVPGCWCMPGGGGGRCGMPGRGGDAREISKNRWSGGPVRSGGRAGFPWAGLPNRTIVVTVVPDCLFCLSGYPRVGVPRLSASPAFGLHRPSLHYPIWRLVSLLFYFIFLNFLI